MHAVCIRLHAACIRPLTPALLCRRRPDLGEGLADRGAGRLAVEPLADVFWRVIVQVMDLKHSLDSGHRLDQTGPSGAAAVE
jgi:hypothetical protein